MIHQAGSTRIDAKLELGRPALLDDIGRVFRDLRVIIAHCGHPLGGRGAVPADQAPELLRASCRYLHRHADPARPVPTAAPLRALFVPLEKLFFGTDYPGFLYDPVALRESC